MHCTNCGKPLPDNATFCGECGAPVLAQQASNQPLYQQQVFQQPNTYQQQNAYQQPNPQNMYRQAPPVQKKKHRALTAIIIILVILLALAAAIYFLVPGLLRPYDLGVRYSASSYNSAIDKLQIDKDEAPKTGDASDYEITYGASHQVTATLTSDEVSSFFNENRPDYYALKNVQIRFNSDGTIEASANLDTNYVFSEILEGQYTKEDLKAQIPALGLIPDKVNIYFDAAGSVVNNKIQGLDIKKVSVMGIPIPQDVIDNPETASFIETMLDNYIADVNAKTGTSFDLIQVKNGKLEFNGTLPSSVRHTKLN